jgi:hypothetical protein
MPGHADGISCMVSFSLNPTDPFSDKAGDWKEVEKAIRETLRVTGHDVKDVNVFHMHAAGVTLGRKTKQLEKNAKKRTPRR